MAKFMLLIHTDVKRWADTDVEITPEDMAYTQALKDAGVHVDGAALHPAESAKIVAEGGVVTDGPFAEAAEQLGGYYVLDCADIDEALEWAAKIPGSSGAIEVRPVVEYEG